MYRLLFQKIGDGVYLSHLDLMRVFQRAMSRAGITLKHSQGYSPRPYVSVALPLSIGTESVCELLDFETEGDAPVPENLPELLNATMPAGIVVTEVFSSERKVKHLAFLEAALTLEYDGGVPEGAEAAIEELFSREELVVGKRAKGEEKDTDIRPMIRKTEVLRRSPQEVEVRAVVSAQNPSLNPMLLSAAISRYLPAYAPDFTRCRRENVLDEEGKTFR